MALGDCRGASVHAQVYASASKDAVLEIKIVNFINEFLFTQTEGCTHVVVPRHRADRNKRYRAMWRSAVRSLLKKYSDRGSNQAQGADMARNHKAMTLAAHSKPEYQCIEFRNTDSDKAITCVPVIGIGKNIIKISQEPNERCCADGGFLTASTVPKACRKPEPCQNIKQPSSLGSLAAQKEHGTCSFRFRTLEEKSMAQCPQFSFREPSHIGTQMRESMPAKAANATSTPSRKKPPLPPRSSSLSNLSQSNLVKIARRARPRKKLSAFRSNAWAWIVTLCFAATFMIQGFAGHAIFGKAFLKAAVVGEDRTPQVIRGDSLKVSPHLREILSPTLITSIEGPFLQHKAGSIPVQQSQLKAPQSGYAESFRETSSSSD